MTLNGGALLVSYALLMLMKGLSLSPATAIALHFYLFFSILNMQQHLFHLMQ